MVDLYDGLAVKSAENETHRIRLIQDENAENPRTGWDNMGTMVCWHRRYNLGDKHNHDGPRELFEYLAIEHGDADPDKVDRWHHLKLLAFVERYVLLLPIYGYEHGQITIRASRGGGNPFSCQWDSGFVGWAYVTKKKVREEYSVRQVDQKTRERALSVLVAEVETYDQYLTGDVYGFVLEEKTKVCPGECEGACTCGLYPDDECTFEYTEEDSCWGFYGSDPFENGMTDHFEAELHPLLRKL